MYPKDLTCGYCQLHTDLLPIKINFFLLIRESNLAIGENTSDSPSLAMLTYILKKYLTLYRALVLVDCHDFEFVSNWLLINSIAMQFC